MQIAHCGIAGRVNFFQDALSLRQIWVRRGSFLTEHPGGLCSSRITLELERQVSGVETGDEWLINQ
jgi:hypothetical protein